MRRLFWILVASLLATVASAQSLAEVAAKEKERRKKVAGQETRTITDAELRRMSPRTVRSVPRAQQASDESEETDAAAAEEEASEPEDPTKTEAYWRDRISKVDKRIRELEEELQSPLYTANPRGALERQRLERQLAQAKSERQAIVDEARRKGVPPGWLR